ncbi:MAG: thioredoxin-disulfide reductase [Bacteroidota bacterium]
MHHNIQKVTKKIIIIGGGPAGYTAAIYASRAGLNPLLLAGYQPGGQLTTTTLVENYPGYPQGILGPHMMEQFREQALNFGTEIKQSTVTQVDFKKTPYLITTDRLDTFLAQTVIIATGSQPKWLGIPSETRLKGRGVSSCAVCDGFFFKDKDVAVVGGGDSAAEEALYLAKICRKVYLLIRRDAMRASVIMQKRVMSRKNITILWNTETQEILGREVVEAVQVVNNQSKVVNQISIQGFFLAIGHTPNTSLFKETLALDQLGYIQTKPDSTQTNIPGIFAAGDVQDFRYRQAITAAGTGCMAALEAERFLHAEHAA